MDDTVDSFRVEEDEKEIFEKLKRVLLKELDYDEDGKIKPTLKNLKKVRESKTLKNILLSDS